MTPDRWKEVKAVLEEALERDPAERASLVMAACAGDRALRDEVESLLAAEAETRAGAPRNGRAAESRDR